MIIDLATIDFAPGQGGGGVQPSGTIEISSNGSYDVTSYAEASVSVQFRTQNLLAEYNGFYLPSDGYDGFGQVEVRVSGGAGYTDEDITTRGYYISHLVNNAPFVASYAFATYTGGLETVSLPSATAVMVNAFSGCMGLSDVNLPICENIGAGAFSGCTSLQTVNIPRCRYINASAFVGCTGLTEVFLPEVITIATRAFSGCTNLTSMTLGLYTYKIPGYTTNILNNTPILRGEGSIYVDSEMYSIWTTTSGWSSLAGQFVSVYQSGPVISYSSGLVSGITVYIDSTFKDFLYISSADVTEFSLPNVRNIPDAIIGVFSGCVNLGSAYFPSCTYIGSNAFYGCVNLSSAYFPSCTLVGYDAFRGCASLSEINLPVCSEIGGGAFYGVSSSFTMRLGYNGVVYTPGAGPIWPSYVGSIYVPSDMVSLYQTADFWSQFSDRIFSL